MKTQTEAFTGYNGDSYSIGDRVEIHPGTDLWMRGARYGVVIGSSITDNDRVKVRMDKLPNRKFSGTEDTFNPIN